MVYQALAEYWANSKEPDYDVDVNVLLPGRTSPDKFKVNRENHYTTRTTKVITLHKQSPQIRVQSPHRSFSFSSGEQHKSERGGDGQGTRRSNNKSKSPVEVRLYCQVQLHKSDALLSA